MRARFAALAVLATLAFQGSAHADGMRCGTKLVSDGDSMYQVRNLCGAPDQAVQRMEQRTISQWVDMPCAIRGQVRCGSYVQRVIEVQVDEWLYDFGPHTFVRTAVFENGQIVRVVSGDYGIKQS